MWVFWPKVIGYFDISQRLTAVIFSFRIFQRSILLQQNVSVLSLWISGFKPNYYKWETKYERCERDAHGAVQNCSYKNILTSLLSCHVAVKLFFCMCFLCLAPYLIKFCGVSCTWPVVSRCRLVYCGIYSCLCSVTITHWMKVEWRKVQKPTSRFGEKINAFCNGLYSKINE